MAPVGNIMLLLFQCKWLLGQGNVDLEKKLEIEDFSHSWWEFLDTYPRAMPQARQTPPSNYNPASVHSARTTATQSPPDGPLHTSKQ